MKERWTEIEVLALPGGEHNYFERKSSAFLEKPSNHKEIAKAISAFANSGGGSLIVGVEDDGTVTGCDLIRSGRTTLRDWLEQVVPALVDPILTNFRVHVVEPAENSIIPEGKCVVVVDVGESIRPPHQVADSGTYYCRIAGRSRPATDFYLTALRDRLIAPVLTIHFRDARVYFVRATKTEAWVYGMVRCTLQNDGRVPAKQWMLSLTVGTTELAGVRLLTQQEAQSILTETGVSSEVILPTRSHAAYCAFKIEVLNSSIEDIAARSREAIVAATWRMESLSQAGVSTVLV